MFKKTKAMLIAMTSLLLVNSQAHALINDSKYGTPGELFISVWDQNGARSFYKDLGISMTDFMAGKGCFNGDLSGDANYASFAGTSGLQYDIAAVNTLAGDASNVDKWGYLATSSAGAAIFNANFSAIDNAVQKIQNYIGLLNPAPFTGGNDTSDLSGVFTSAQTGYAGKPSWLTNMGGSVGGNTLGTPGTDLELYFVNNFTGDSSGNKIQLLGKWKLNGTSLSYTGTGTSNVCSSTPSTNPVTPTVTVQASKVFDNTTTATITGCSLTGVTSPDVVTCDFSKAAAKFADANVGNGKTVTITGLVLGGKDVAKYSLASAPVTATASITAASLTATVTVADKVSDGTTTASITGCSLNGVLSGSNVSCDTSGASAQFADASVGTNKTVNIIKLALTGTGAGNYSLASTATSTANITTASPPPPGSYSLAISQTGQGSISGSNGISCKGSCTNSFNSGTVINLTANPAAGFTFAGWGGACSGTGPCSVTVSAAKSVTANFIPLPNYTVTVASSGEGRVTGKSILCGSGGSNCTGSFQSGSQVTLTANPDNDGYVLKSWGGACSGTATTCTFTISGNTSVSAQFGPPVYPGVQMPLAVKIPTGKGSVTSHPVGIDCGGSSNRCGYTFTKKTRITLRAAPVAGAVFKGWSGACSGKKLACTVTMGGRKSVTAKFK